MVEKSAASINTVATNNLTVEEHQLLGNVNTVGMLAVEAPVA